MREIKHTIFSCVRERDVIYPVVFIEMSLGTYVQTSLSKIANDKKKKKKTSKDDSPLFDFIEYNGGISLDPLYQSNLRGLGQLLEEEGAIGVTYFTRNVHREAIKTMVTFSSLFCFIFLRHKKCQYRCFFIY